MKDSGEVVERQFPIGEAPDVITDKGAKAYRNIAVEQRRRGKRRKVDPWGDGLASEAMAVHPDQIPEAKAYDKRHRVSVEYNPYGAPIFRSRSQRRQYLKAYGYRDNDGGYGDG